MEAKVVLRVAATAALAAAAWVGLPQLFRTAAPGPAPAAASPSPCPTPAGRPSPTPSASPSPSPPPLSFVDTTLPALRAASDRKSEVVHVLIANAGDKPIDAKVNAVLRTVRGQVVEPVTSVACTIEGRNSARSVPLVLDLRSLQPGDYPLSGWLFLESDGKAVQKLEIKTVAGPPDSADWPLVERALIEASWCLGLAAFWLAFYTPRGVGVLFRRMGAPTWSFSESWSSTLTIAGAVLASLLTFAALPEHGQTFSKKSYALLSLLLAAVIALAPGVYNLFRQPIPSTNPVQYRGIVLMFLVAGVLTMTGGLAQLSLVRSLISDTAGAGLMSRPLADFFGWLCQGLKVLLWIYGLFSAVQIVMSQTAPPDQRGGLEAVRAGQPTAPGWPLL